MQTVHDDSLRCEGDADDQAQLAAVCAAARRHLSQQPRRSQEHETKWLADLRERHPSQEMGWTKDQWAAAHTTLERGDHVELAERLGSLLQASSKTTFTEGQFFRYGGHGVFCPIGGAELSRLVQGFAGNWVVTGQDKSTGELKVKPMKVKAADVKGVISMAADQADDPDFFNDAKPGIAFAGSFVEVTPFTMIEHDSSPNHRARVAYDFEFDARAVPRLFLQTLDQIFRDDDDRDDKIDFLQEIAGMSLIGRGTQHQKVALFTGAGANGKSLAASVIERCFPEESVIAVPPQSLDEDYKRARFTGAKLNVVSELPENEIVASEPWKAMVDGSKLSARSPYKDVFFFRPTAGHIYSANRLPGTADHSQGFWRRWVVITFNRTFAADEQDATLADRIIETERPAIVAWLLRGAQRALNQGCYTVPPSSDRALTKWKSTADQVAAYVESECVRLEAGAHAPWAKASSVYADYQAWAMRTGHKAMSLVKFGERMQGLGLGSDRQGRGCLYPVRVLQKGDLQ